MIQWREIGSATVVAASTAAVLASGGSQDRTSRSRTAFAGKLPVLDGQRLEATLVEVTYPPGGVNPSHRHPCPVIGYVLEGGLRMLESFDRFLARTAELNAWAPAFLIPILAWSATVAEVTLAVTLIVGIGVRWAAFGSAVLLAWFATAMLVYTGLKPPLDYSVYSASACALLLALHDHRSVPSQDRRPDASRP